MWWCYGIQQTDKTGLVNLFVAMTDNAMNSLATTVCPLCSYEDPADEQQNLSGLQADTGMHGKQYSYLTVWFVHSYLPTCRYAVLTESIVDVAYAVFEVCPDHLVLFERKPDHGASSPRTISSSDSVSFDLCTDYDHNLR